MLKSKESFHQLPSAAGEHDYTLMDDAENGTNLEDDEASYQTDSSESENDELLPFIDILDPVDPVYRIKEAKCVGDYPNAVSMLLIITFALKHKLSGIAIRLIDLI